MVSSTLRSRGRAWGVPPAIHCLTSLWRTSRKEPLPTTPQATTILAPLRLSSSGTKSLQHYHCHTQQPYQLISQLPELHTLTHPMDQEPQKPQTGPKRPQRPKEIAGKLLTGPPQATDKAGQMSDKPFQVKYGYNFLYLIQGKCHLL